MLKYLLFLLSVTLASAQVRLQYLDLGSTPSPCCMVVDAKGNTYAAGAYPTGVTNAGGIAAQKIIVTRLGPSGNLIHRSIFGGSYSDYPSAIAVDSNGNLFVAGSTDSPDFPLVNPLISNWNGGFLSKINPSGTLVYSTFIGSAQSSDSQTSVNAMALDASGNVYLTGLTYAAHFPVTWRL